MLARHVVGADGLGSRVARAVGAPLTLERPTSGAALYAYFAGDWSGIEYHVAPERAGRRSSPPTAARPASGSAPRRTSPAGTSARGRATRSLTGLLAELAPRLRRPGRRAPPRPRRCGACCGCRTTSRQAAGPGWALVGDAGYHRDAITGHGISDAFRDAELLAVALDEALRGPVAESAALAGYGRHRDRMARPIFDLTCALAAFPGPERFVELQRQLAVAIDDQAGELAARPSRAAAAAA